MKCFLHQFKQSDKKHSKSFLFSCRKQIKQTINKKMSSRSLIMLKLPQIKLFQRSTLQKICPTFANSIYIITFSKLRYQQQDDLKLNIIISQQRLRMSESVLGRIYRESSSRCHREKVDITGLTEEEFLKTFNSDPFFRERVKVELEKISKSTEGVNLKLLLEEGRSEDSDLSEITLKKKNSLDSGREFEKYQRYINLLTCQK